MEQSMTDSLLKAATDGFHQWLYTMDTIKNRYSASDYQKILKWIHSCARDVKEEDIVAVANSDFDLNGFKTGVFFTDEYMYGPHTKPIYLYKMKSVTIDKQKRHEVAFTVTYESEKISGQIKGTWAGQIVFLLKSLTGRSKVLSTAEIRRQALSLRNAGKEAEFVELLAPLAESDGESASILAQYYFEKDSETALAYIEKAQKLHHFFGFYLAGVMAVNKKHDLKEGYDYFLKAYEYGMPDIEKDILDIQTNLSKLRPPFTPVVYEYNTLEKHPKTLVGAYVDSLLFHDYLIEELKKIPFYIMWRTDEEYYKDVYKTFVHAGNALDYSIINYCRHNDRIGTSIIPSMYLEKEFKNIPIRHILDMKSYGYEYNSKYPSSDPFAQFKPSHGLAIVAKLKKAKPSLNRQDNLAFIEECILSYETLMDEFKTHRAELIAIYQTWNETKISDKYNIEKFDRYLEKAREIILSTDQNFLDAKKQFMTQAGLSESDLFTGDVNNYERIIKYAKLKYEAAIITEADSEKGLVHFESYTGSDYSMSEVKKLLSKEKQRTLNFNKVLFYESTTYSLLTTDALYLSSIDEPIPLTNALCCKLTDKRQFVIVYKNMEEKVYNCDEGVRIQDVRTALRFVNRILIEL